MPKTFELPLSLGTASGHNVSTIFDLRDNGVAQLFGLPMHTRIDDRIFETSKRFADARDDAEFIVRAVNDHDALVQSINDILASVPWSGIPADVLARARSLVGDL